MVMDDNLFILFPNSKFLEAKASKDMHVCIEKQPDRHLVIHPH